jgi:hypothetical protein
MNPTLKNILAVVAGFIIGSIVNMSLINVSGMFIPPPEGADTTTMEGLKASMHLFGPKHFIFPFLAHALGTFSGALIAALIAATKRMMMARIIGGAFMVGGIINIILLPSPLWFTALDLLLAYVPMAYLAGKLVLRNKE